MSKPIARVLLFVLISLALIAATSFSVRGWLGGKTEVSGAQAHLVSGLQTNFNHDRSSVSELETRQIQAGNQSLYKSDMGHGCESEARMSPED